MASWQFEWLFFPPGGVILITLLGLIFYRRRWGRLFTGCGLIALWAASTPAVSYLLVERLQWKTPIDLQKLADSGAQAIVVLAGGRQPDTLDFGDTVSVWTFKRLRYAAFLHRTTQLPILVTGGGGGDEKISPPEAPLMKQVLEEEFGVKVTWSEQASLTTYENALLSRDILAAEGISRILLVTQALHMTRALPEFEKAGFEVIPAPTDFILRRYGMHAWIPSAKMLYETHLALHELVGGWWYRLRY